MQTTSDNVLEINNIEVIYNKVVQALRGLSLVELLGLDPTVSVTPAQRVMPRMLIVAAPGGPVVVPVDEVDGIHNIEERVLNTASLSGEHASAIFTRGVLHWKTRSLRWLDEEQLLGAITRSLT